jgi:UDP-GlcNAc:undecaprenyl-phosphate GlcNAc-1-phosphate transferase
MTAAFLGALLGGVVGTWLARWLAWRIGFVSHPNPIVPQHVRSVAYLGGLGIAIGVAIGSALAGVAAMPPGALVGVLAFFVLGAVDDATPLKPLTKLAAQLVLATLAVFVSDRSDGLLEMVVAVLWIVTVVNAVNLTDVCDGLVASLAIVSLAAAGMLTTETSGFAWVAAAACAGFWLFNRAPASIFLGDAGSHLLGFAIATSWLAVWQSEPSWSRASGAVLGNGVFLLELAFLIVVRNRRGLAFWRGSPDHLALRLQAAGLSKQQTVAVALVPAIVLASVAIWLCQRPGTAAMAIASVVVGLMIHLVVVLYRREPVPRAGRTREERR